MRRLVLVLISLLVGVQGCTRSGDSPPVVAGEQVVAGSGTGVLPPPSGSQTGYAVAFDGASYLVVWSDVRGATGADVYAARVSPSGALVDGALITVTAAAGDQLLPEVAFDGTNYLVVWQNGLSGDRNVQGARVSRAGVVLDTTPITIAQSDRKVNPVVAFDGTNYLVVWEDQRLESSDIYGARVSPAGAVVTAAFLISGAAGQQVQPALACVVGACLATWRDGRNGGPDVYGARIGATAVLDPAGIAISRASSSQGAPAVAGDGTRFLVAWGDSRNGTADVYGARVDAGGNVLDPGGAPISLAPGAQQAAAIAFEGRWFVVVWEDYRSGTGYDVYGARVGADAAVLDPGGFVVEPGTVGARAAIASDGAGRSLVASDRRQVVDPVLGTAVSRLSARILISRATLTVSRAGTGSGTVTSTPAGIDCGTICSAFFDAPTDVNLTPTAAPGSAFVSWAGACSGPGPCTVTVNDTRAVTATFSPTHVLTVARSGTAGTVVSSPAGIDCGTSCSAEYVEGSFVDLTPTPGTNSLFASWSAPCDVPPAIYDPLYLTTSPTCRVPITQAQTVTASFTAGFKLTVNATGTASGRVDAQTYWPIHCATGSTAGCSSMVLANTPVTLAATPAANAILKSWSGCTSSSALECTVSLTAAKTVTATFQPSTYLLTTVATGTGTGTVTGTGISCATGSGGDCTEPVANGDTVTLTAAPGPDSILKSWSGCLTYSGTSCTVTMTGAKKVTATFQPSTFPLTLNSTGGGGGTVSSETAGFTCTVLSGVPCTRDVRERRDGGADGEPRRDLGVQELVGLLDVRRRGVHGDDDGAEDADPEDGAHHLPAERGVQRERDGDRPGHRVQRDDAGGVQHHGGERRHGDAHGDARRRLDREELVGVRLVVGDDLHGHDDRREDRDGDVRAVDLRAHRGDRGDRDRHGDRPGHSPARAAPRRDCTAPVANGDTVTLTATPDADVDLQVLVGLQRPRRARAAPSR